MSSTDEIDDLLNDLQTGAGDELVFDKDKIHQDISADQVAYKGMGIKILSIAGGLLACLFFMIFLMMIVENSPIAMVLTGFIAIGLAIFVNKMSINTVVDTICISSYLIGIALICYGLNHRGNNDNLTAAILIVVAIITTVLSSGYMLNFFSTLVISGCLFAFININNTYNLLHLLTLALAAGYTLINLYEAKLITISPAINVRFMPWRNGLLFALLALLIYLALSTLPFRYDFADWISSVIIIVVLLFALYHILNFLNITQRSTQALIYCLSLLILGSAIFSPEVCGALLILLVSFHTWHRIGLTGGLLFLIYFVGLYYYNLEYTLLIKSAMMFATGLLFLTGWFIFKNQLKRYEHI